MKKRLLYLCTILLIVGCSKAEPKQEEEPVIKGVSYTEEVPVAGASYNPNVQDGDGIEEEIVPVKEEIEPEVVTEEVVKPMAVSPKKSEPIIVEVPEEDIDTSITDVVVEKIKEDEKTTKAAEVTKPEVVSSEPVDEPEEKKSPTIWIVLGAIAAGVGGFLFKKA